MERNFKNASRIDCLSWIHYHGTHLEEAAWIKLLAAAKLYNLLSRDLHAAVKAYLALAAIAMDAADKVPFTM